MILGLGAGKTMNLTPYGIQYDQPLQRLREVIEYTTLLWKTSPDEPYNYKIKFLVT